MLILDSTCGGTRKSGRLQGSGRLILGSISLGPFSTAEATCAFGFTIAMLYSCGRRRISGTWAFPPQDRVYHRVLIPQWDWDDQCWGGRRFLLRHDSQLCDREEDTASGSLCYSVSWYERLAAIGWL